MRTPTSDQNWLDARREVAYHLTPEGENTILLDYLSDVARGRVSWHPRGVRSIAQVVFHVKLRVLHENSINDQLFEKRWKRKENPVTVISEQAKSKRTFGRPVRR